MRGFLHRFPAFAAGLALGLGAGPPQAAPPDAETVRIAVRVDARPFIWKDAVSGKYLGFLWDVCTEAVQRAGYTFSEIEVDAGTRAAFLRDGTGGFDLLCDPTTITLERIENFLADGAPPLEFTPIIFVANASYVGNPRRRTLSGREADEPPDCEELIRRTVEGAAASGPTSAAVQDTGAAPARGWLSRLERRFDFTLRLPEPESLPPQRSFQIWGYVSGSTIGAALETDAVAQDGMPYPAVTCLRPLPSHGTAAAEFCAGRLDRYYGDLDIVRAAVADQAALNGGTCEVKQAEATEITYEPYALVVSARLPDFPEHITLALYGMFGDGTVDRLFAGHFPETGKSPYLATLFRLNSIPAGVDPPGPEPRSDGP